MGGGLLREVATPRGSILFLYSVAVVKKRWNESNLST